MYVLVREENGDHKMSGQAEDDLHLSRHELAAFPDMWLRQEVQKKSSCNYLEQAASHFTQTLEMNKMRDVCMSVSTSELYNKKSKLTLVILYLTFVTSFFHICSFVSHTSIHQYEKGMLTKAAFIWISL